MSWNQWNVAPPIPSTHVTPQASAVQPPTPANTYSSGAVAAPPSLPSAPPVNPSFNYGTMTPEQQYAIQQNWQQWQAYQQQYAQWHAQYGEQYQREMQAKLGSAAPQIPYGGGGGVSTSQAPTSNIVSQPITTPSLPGYTQNLPPPLSMPTSFLNAPPPPPEQDPQKFSQTNSNRPPPPPLDNPSHSQPFQTKTNELSGNLYRNKSIDGRNTSFENDNSFNTINNNSNDNKNVHQSLNKSMNSAIFDRTPDKLQHEQKSNNMFNQNQTIYSRSSENQIESSNPNEKSREEILFDEQFKKWEEEFENWKKANVNHPDRKAYREYEMKFEDCRRKLVERREQMRKRKLEQLQKNIIPQPQNQNIQYKEDTIKCQPIRNEPLNSSQILQQEEMMPLKPKIEEMIVKVDDPNKNRIEENKKNEENNDISKKQKQPEFLISSNSTDGIPGLDLVRDEEKKVKKNKDDNIEDIVEVIDLEKQNNNTSPKKANWESDQSKLSSPKDKIPSLIHNMTPTSNKIPSLFDKKIEKPDFSPPRKPFDSDKELNNSSTPISTENDSNKQQPLNAGSIPDDITKVLQDPSLLALLSTALLKGNAFDTNEKKPASNVFGNDHINESDSDFRNQSRDMNNDRYSKNIWDDQDNRRQDWSQRSDMNFPRFGVEFGNNMNQRNRMENSSMQWQNSDRNDNRGSNFFNNERNRGGFGETVCGFGDRRFEENDNNDNFYRDNDNNRGFNPFKRDNAQNREDNARNRIDIDKDINRNQNTNNRGRDRDRNIDKRNENRRSNNNRSRSPSRNKNNRSRSNNRNNRFDDRKPDFDERKQFSPNEKSSSAPFNPFRRGGETSSSMFGTNKNQSESDEYFKPAQVIDYQNKSLKSNTNQNDAIFPLTKVVDYGHKHSESNPKEVSKPPDNYFPMKTIDYGHSSTKKGEKEEKKPEKPASSLGGGFGDFLASKTMGSGSGSRDNSKVEDFKPPVYNDSRFTFNNTESEQRSGQVLLSASKQGNRFNQLEFNNINSNNHGIYNANIIDSYNTKNRQYQFKDMKCENNNNSLNKNSIIDVDEISDDDDEKCFSDATKNVTCTTTSTKTTNANISTSFSTYITNVTSTKDSNVYSENILNAPPPPPLISAKMLALSSSINKPTYSYNYNSNNDHFENVIKDYSNIPCPTPSTNNNDKQLIFPSMENNNTIPIDEILLNPGRLSRPKKIVIILRGPPGSGKSYLAKLIKEKEIEMKGSQPRILSIDDYFMVEVDKEGRCPKTNRKIVQQDLVYEFDKDMEVKYIECLLKSFKKTLTEGLFNFVIIDCHNQSLRTFTEFYNIGKAEGFTPYTIDLICDIEKCLENNIHNRNHNEIKDIIQLWNETPEHYIKLDIKNLFAHNTADIQEVEMEDAFLTADSNSEENSQELKNDDSQNEDENSNNENFMDTIKSKWDVDPTEERLARLDGINKKLYKHKTLEDYLQVDGWEPPSSNSKNKKRVRWADIEEKRAQDKMRAIGFVVGQTDWSRMMDPSGGQSALTKTKYIERLNKTPLRKQ